MKSVLAAFLRRKGLTSNLVGGYDDHGMTIEEIAEAVDTTVEDVNACFAFLTDKGYRSAKH
jgi:methionyl-tRNA synthetase